MGRRGSAIAEEKKVSHDDGDNLNLLEIFPKEHKLERGSNQKLALKELFKVLENDKDCVFIEYIETKKNKAEKDGTYR